MGGRIVVGVDGSPSSRGALDFAVKEAQRRDADLEAVMAYRWTVYYPGMEYSSVPPPSKEQVEAETMELLLKAVTHVPKQIRLDPIVVDGGSAHVLIEAAKGAELLVVGSRGRGGFRGLLLGSTSHQVVSHATCPVVVVP
ncbi:MAG: nucleotide-binding universal stress UspA family protein, partial [Glaciecola sp.]